MSAVTVANGNGADLVFLDEGRAVADSRQVAQRFGKAHSVVLRSIRNLECSDEFKRCNFASFKNKDLTGETTSHYTMTRDGFMFLAMGFTGKAAAKWKEDYINAFNMLETQAVRATVDADAMSMLARTDGISRMVANKVTNIERSIPAIIERVTERIAEQAVAEYMASSNLLVRRGQTAETIWLRHGLPKGMRGATNWFGNRLSEMGCAAGRADRANGQIRLFDPDKADICMKNGLLHKSKVYASERMGQSKFKLIGGKP